MKRTKRKPIPVGSVLQTVYLEPMDITVKQLAETIGVNRNTVSRIVNNRQVLTVPMAVKLGAALGTTAEFWLNIQHATELWQLRNQEFPELAEGIECLCPENAA